MIRLAIVKRVAPGKVWITIPTISPADVWGPCVTLEHVRTKDLVTKTKALTTDIEAGHQHTVAGHVHDLTPTPLAPGDKVLVTTLDDSQDTWAVLGRIEPS
jgi:hypothetical protein